MIGLDDVEWRLARSGHRCTGRSHVAVWVLVVAASDTVNRRKLKQQVVAIDEIHRSRRQKQNFVGEVCGSDVEHHRHRFIIHNCTHSHHIPPANIGQSNRATWPRKQEPRVHPASQRS